ncbi:MAG: hypothetical protein ACE5FT_01545 [Candidatus Nanoarchaeia archaeon]
MKRVEPPTIVYPAGYDRDSFVSDLTSELKAGNSGLIQEWAHEMSYKNEPQYLLRGILWDDDVALQGLLSGAYVNATGDFDRVDFHKLGGLGAKLEGPVEKKYHSQLLYSVESPVNETPGLEDSVQETPISKVPETTYEVPSKSIFVRAADSSYKTAIYTLEGLSRISPTLAQTVYNALPWHADTFGDPKLCMSLSGLLRDTPEGREAEKLSYKYGREPLFMRGNDGEHYFIFDLMVSIREMEAIKCVRSGPQSNPQNVAEEFVATNWDKKLEPLHKFTENCVIPVYVTEPVGLLPGTPLLTLSKKMLKAIGEPECDAKQLSLYHALSVVSEEGDLQKLHEFARDYAFGLVDNGQSIPSVMHRVITRKPAEGRSILEELVDQLGKSKPRVLVDAIPDSQLNGVIEEPLEGELAFSAIDNQFVEKASGSRDACLLVANSYLGRFVDMGGSPANVKMAKERLESEEFFVYPGVVAGVAALDWFGRFVRAGGNAKQIPSGFRI